MTCGGLSFVLRCDVDYGARHPRWHEADAEAKADAVVQLVERSGQIPASVLDVGCGPGFVMDALAVRWPGVERTGVEPSPLESERPNIYRGTLEDHRGLRADLVCALDVMEHTDDDVAFLRALAQRGPRIVLRIPLDVSVVDALTGRTRAHRENLGHRFAYTRRRALERVSSAGLEIIDDAYHAIPYPGRLAGLRAWGALRWPHLTYRLLGGASLMVLARAPV